MINTQSVINTIFLINAKSWLINGTSLVILINQLVLFISWYTTGRDLSPK